MQNPDDHKVLADAIISSEPLGPVFAEHDTEWREVISWSIYATIYGSAHNVSQENVEQQLNSERPDIRRLLGREGEIGSKLGLDNDFAYNIIRSLGNYSEIFDRNLGPETEFAIDPGPNKVGRGGLLFSPPFR
jgi:general L-amino acid transport system substrate-binding protein